MAYEAIIGMEVHAQVITASKMFCGCSADYAATPPNTHVCPICLAMPGVLPVINSAAVEATVLTGMALHCHIPGFTKFDRKNYPYPDLPKGYQISQYDYPFCVNGWLEIPTGQDGETRRIGIRRVHLEEDTAKLIHANGASLVDYNRAGVPLMEIVTEADMRSADDAWHYLTRLRTILRYLGVNSGNMEEGAMRCEANVSVRLVGADEFGTKVEIKNLNSFRSVRLAIAYEIERQSRVLDEGGRVHQVTMGWDEERLRTVFQRSKEGSADYRYFPEPDLPPIEFSPEAVDIIRRRLPELPEAKRARFMAEYGLRAEDTALLVEDRRIAEYYERAVQAAQQQRTAVIGPQIVANWMLGEIFRLLRESGGSIDDIAVTPEALVELVAMVRGGAINATVAKEVLEEMVSTGASAPAIVERRGLTQISDEDALARVVREVLETNPGPVQQYLEGKESVFGFLMGQAMRATKGQANVQVVRELLQAELNRLRG
jgi:aspartyl-tRNA(Asn)/glutamyl-tRNA(Gln) amidotransferase subunit B